MPAASMAACTRYDVVVLPFVPVMPTTRILRLGWPKKCAASRASASRPSLTVTHATGHPSGAPASATTATAPFAMACPAKAEPSACIPRSATKSAEGDTARESYAIDPTTGSGPAPPRPGAGGCVSSPLSSSTVRSSDSLIAAAATEGARVRCDRATAGMGARVRARRRRRDPGR